ncbi:MAG: MBL fold metallo-hydrolase [Methanomassiliicoccales archaeon]|nr:MBL fold metallo-hydrolase [Methanomassiliicoccales archaeon]
MSAKVTVFDGADCIGGNKIHLDFDGHGIFFDFGLNYHRLSQFYEEFLNPRVSRGIHDHILMGLIPNIACYREDLIPSDLDMSGAQRLNVDAVFLSHAHMDHVGSAGLLDTSIPFISTPTTAALLKAMRDSSTSGFQYEAAYTSPRFPTAEDDRVLASSSKEDYQGRRLMLPCSCPGPLAEFMARCPSKTKGIVGGSVGDCSSLAFDTKCFEVDHSIYGASALAVETSLGWVVYSGDLRTHGRFGEKTEAFVRAAKALNPRLLIIEGTRASREDREDSEATVKETCLGHAENEDSLVVADFSARNFERLDTFAEIAKETGRQLVILSKDAYMLDALECADSVDHVKDLLVYGDLKSKRSGFESMVYERHEDILVDPSDIAKNPDQYIVSLSFYDMGKLLDIGPEGGTYIYSSSEAYTEEQVIDFRRLDSWLKMFKLDVKGFEIVEASGQLVPEFPPGYHASGHASASSLLRIIETIDPEHVMPVHTERPDFFKEKLGAKVIVPRSGIAHDL